MRNTIPFMTLWLLTSCIPPETGIDNTRVVGVVRVEPQTVMETSDLSNDQVNNPVVMDELFYGYRILEGVLTGFDHDVENDDFGPDADLDYWLVISPTNRGVDPDDTNTLDIDITLEDPTANARVLVKNLDELSGPGGAPSDVSQEDFTGWVLHSFPAQAGARYAVGIGGLAGTGPVNYNAFMMGEHPDDAGILVGAYANEKADDRGSLYGGASVKPFRPTLHSVETQMPISIPLAFETWYEMLNLREFLEDEKPNDDKPVKPNENIRSGYVFGGTWANLSQTLPAGTWHSKRGVATDFSKPGPAQLLGTPPEGYEESAGDTGLGADEDDYETRPLIDDIPTYPTVTVPETVVIDTVAPIVVGWETDEIEPNDSDGYDLSGAQDLGMLSGIGFVDIVRGELIYDGYGYWYGDNDLFKFQVPETLQLAFALDWTGDTTDLDVQVYDSAGNEIDRGWYGHPEISELGPAVLEPGSDYYIEILLWVTPEPEGAAIPWELKLEQLAP